MVSTTLALLGLGDAPSFIVPDSRLQDGNDARRLLASCLQEDQQRSLQRALTKGLIDGNPPYNDWEVAPERRWECRLNFMEGQAIMDSSAVPYYNLFANVPYYAECHTAYQPDDSSHEQWNENITLRFHNMLKRWRGFDWNVQQISYWMRLHGIGVAFHDKEGDWRFRSLETGALLAPKGAASCIDKRMPFLILRIPYRIIELYDWIKDEETATKAGANVEAIKLAIKYGMKGMGGSSNWWAQPWEYYQRILKNHDLIASFTDVDLVYCAVMLVREFNGKISKFVFTENAVPASDDATPKDSNFLFEEPHKYDSYQEALSVFFLDSGDGSFHSVRGLAMKAFKHLEASNRLKCQAVNRAFIDSSVVLSPGTSRNNEKLALTVWGTTVKLPAGAEVKQTVIQGGTQGVMEVDRMLTNHLSNNIGMFNQRTLSREDGKGQMPTATQVNQQVAKESSLSQGQITLFYQQLDPLYENMFRLAVESSDEEAKRFVQECIEDGVPKEALKNMEYVRANRESGYGSPQMALLKQQQMMSLLPMLPEEGKNFFLKHAVTNIEGPEMVKFLVPDTHVPSQDDSIAALENGLIQEGREPVISSGQDDVIHLTSHLQDATDTLEPVNEAIQQGQNDPQALQEAFKYVQIMIPHCEAHLARMQNDVSRGREYKLFQEQLMNLVAFSGKLRGALKEAIRSVQIARDQQQTATSLDALTAAKVRAVEAGTQQAALKTASHIQNQAAKTQSGIRLKSVSQAADILLQGAKTRAEQNKKLTTPNVLDSKVK